MEVLGKVDASEEEKEKVWKGMCLREFRENKYQYSTVPPKSRMMYENKVVNRSEKPPMLVAHLILNHLNKQDSRILIPFCGTAAGMELLVMEEKVNSIVCIDNLEVQIKHAFQRLLMYLLQNNLEWKNPTKEDEKKTTTTRKELKTVEDELNLLLKAYKEKKEK